MLEENSTAHFEPVIALPDLVEVLTGEENETPVYCHRAKLYRWDGSEFKERGLGDVKILTHKQTGVLPDTYCSGLLKTDG